MHNTVFCVFMVNERIDTETMVKIFDTRAKAENYISQCLDSDHIMGMHYYKYNVCEMMVH